MLLHPRVLTVFGCGAHENDSRAPVRARERVVGSVTETLEQNKRRQGDIGIIGVLGVDQIQLIDITVSDGGGQQTIVALRAWRAMREEGSYETRHLSRGQRAFCGH